MGELQEIRRFWPWMRPADWFGDKRAFWAGINRGVQVTVGRRDAVLFGKQGWDVSFFDSRPFRRCKTDPWNGNQFFTTDPHFGPTIAAAMAAAGFAERKKPSEFTTMRRKFSALTKACQKHWPSHTHKPLESRQRPRKKVRLGKAKRLGGASAELSIVLRLWDLGDEQRLDRGEIGRD